MEVGKFPEKNVDFLHTLLTPPSTFVILFLTSYTHFLSSLLTSRAKSMPRVNKN